MDHTPSGSDYHALSKDEIRRLLEIARDSTGVGVVSDIQVRLLQGIVGITCPRQDAHMQQWHRIGTLYMGFLESDDRETASLEFLADALYETMLGTS